MTNRCEATVIITSQCVRGAIKLVMAASVLSVPRLNASFPRPTIDRAIGPSLKQFGNSTTAELQTIKRMPSENS